MRPTVDVLDTTTPDWAKVMGIQMSTNVPPPPSVTHRLGYCPSQRRLRSGSAVGVLFYWVARGATSVVGPLPPRQRAAFMSGSVPGIHSGATRPVVIPFVSSPIPVLRLL